MSVRTSLSVLTLALGIPRDELQDDPQLGSRRQQQISIAAKRLAAARMIQFDPNSGYLNVTELGNIAAKYYIRHTSVEIFNKEFRPNMAEADVLVLLSKSTEVRQPTSCCTISLTPIDITVRPGSSQGERDR